MGYGLQHLCPAFLHRTWYVDFLSGWSHGGEERLQNITKKPIRLLLLLLSLNKFCSETRLHCWIWLIDTVYVFLLVCSVLHSIAYAYLLIMIYLFKANFLTGLINLAIPTMYTSDVWAVVILVLYSITHCGVPPFFPFWREDEAINGRLLMMRIFYIPILLNRTVN